MRITKKISISMDSLGVLSHTLLLQGQALKATVIVATAVFLFTSSTLLSGVQGCDRHHHHYAHHDQDHTVTEVEEEEEDGIFVEQEGRSLRARLHDDVDPPSTSNAIATIGTDSIGDGLKTKKQFLKQQGGGRARAQKNNAQRCGTQEPTKAEILMVQANLAEYRKKRQKYQRRMKEQRQDNDEMINIDVYFHIITDSEGNGDVTDEQVKTQIHILNDVFSGTNAMSPSCDGSTPKEPGVKAPIQFTLKNIERVANDAWFGAELGTNAEVEMRLTLHKGDCTTLNVYSIGYSSALGWSSLPWHGCPSDGTTDDYKTQGITLSYETLPGNIAPDFMTRYDQGITLPHEAGHFLGLFHTFQTTGVFGSCYGIGDGIADTTPGIGFASGCNKLLDTCPGVSGYDAVDNVMNYSDDCCMETFTPMQIEEMISAYYKYLKGEPLPDDPPIVVGEGDFPVITFP